VTFEAIVTALSRVVPSYSVNPAPMQVSLTATPGTRFETMRTLDDFLKDHNGPSYRPAAFVNLALQAQTSASTDNAIVRFVTLTSLFVSWYFEEQPK